MRDRPLCTTGPTSLACEPSGEFCFSGCIEALIVVHEGFHAREEFGVNMKMLDAGEAWVLSDHVVGPVQ